MSIKGRKERERAERERLIVTAARDLAEAEGWDAVTTRRLAAEIEYSQPVLYSHFSGKDAIMAAVALEGFSELAVRMRDARTSADTPRAALAAVGAAYYAFAGERPAIYDAMFVHAVDLPFATVGGPEPLWAAFGELTAALEPLARGAEVETLAEVFWSGLHGMSALVRSGRLPAENGERRLELYVEQFVSWCG
ncbi:MAG: TetR/AcrR family transcriptional regulator [Nonomuraea sp.]|nr:TetR/AcrR family transcriptional regulator [Nonomuraea sp.]